MILVGDIGGTKSRLAIFRAGTSLPAPLREAVFPSSRYGNLAELVRTFLSLGDQRVDAAVFGVAGPVVGGRAKLTNLPWVLDRKSLAAELGLKRVILLNDLLATAAAIPHLRREAIETLQQGREDPRGNIAVIAPGTGLGEAFVTRDGNRPRAYATEGGHADFAPRNGDELALRQEMVQRAGRVSYETVCSGPGIARIYDILGQTGLEKAIGRVQNDPENPADPVPGIVAAALRAVDPCSLAVKTLRLYAGMLGAEAGNLALKILATGGLYLAGGIPPRILPFLKEEGFLRAFRDKAPMSDLMARIPVHVVLEPRTALLGAACWFREREMETVSAGCPEGD